MEGHAIEFLQQVVGKFDIGLVDLVDQQHRQARRGESLPQLALADIIGNVVDARVAQLPVAQAGDGVIFVQALMRLGRRFDVPFDQRRVERLRDFLRQHRLARARLPLHQQRAAQQHRGIDRDLQVIGRDIILGAFKAHEIRPLPLLPATGLGKAAVGRNRESGGQSGRPRKAARAASKSHRPRCWASNCRAPN